MMEHLGPPLDFTGVWHKLRSLLYFLSRDQLCMLFCMCHWVRYSDKDPQSLWSNYYTQLAVCINTSSPVANKNSFARGKQWACHVVAGFHSRDLLLANPKIQGKTITTTKKDKKTKLAVQLSEKHWDSQTGASVLPSVLGREISCHMELLREN